MQTPKAMAELHRGENTGPPHLEGSQAVPMFPGGREEGTPKSLTKWKVLEVGL